MDIVLIFFFSYDFQTQLLKWLEAEHRTITWTAYWELARIIVGHICSFGRKISLPGQVEY